MPESDTDTGVGNPLKQVIAFTWKETLALVLMGDTFLPDGNLEILVTKVPHIRAKHKP